MRQHIVVTASGTDRQGIIERFTKVLLGFDGNVEASRMARLGGEFAIIMLVSVPTGKATSLREELTTMSSSELEVQSRLTEDRKAFAVPGFIPCDITVMGADHLGIIHSVAKFLAEQGIIVETMDTDIVAAPMSGSPLFTMSAAVRIPPDLAIDKLRETLEEVGEEVGVGTNIQPRISPTL